MPRPTLKMSRSGSLLDGDGAAQALQSFDCTANGGLLAAFIEVVWAQIPLDGAVLLEDVVGDD